MRGIGDPINIVMKIYTIGFTKTTARNFFERLQKSGAKKLVDVRLNNISQLAGFAKRDDLAYFSERICGMAYQHVPEFAPTQGMLDAYKKDGGDWGQYAQRFLGLMAERQVERFKRDDIHDGCLLCSEDKPHHCHRRLVAEYLKEKWGDVEITHL
jgi:uncharacterized protein (DUF488 family)